MPLEKKLEILENIFPEYGRLNPHYAKSARWPQWKHEASNRGMSSKDYTLT